MKRFCDGHDECLTRLVDHLDEIGERPDDVEFVFREGVWLQKYSTKHYKLPDLIIGYYPEFCQFTVAELKSNRRKKGCAVAQLDSGEEFVRTVLRPSFPYDVVRKVVYYNGNGFKYDVV